MLSRTFTLTKSNQAAFTSKLVCPKPCKSIVSHLPNHKRPDPSTPNAIKMNLLVNFRSNSTNSKKCKEDWILEQKNEMTEELGSYQSLEDLKNIEFLRSSTQNPVEKDFFFQSLNGEKTSNTSNPEEYDDFFDI